jgi:predicted MPP superfamily phosphohydrolase
MISMGRFASYLVFVGALSGILIALHYYVWLRKVRDSNLPQPWRRIVSALLGIGCVVVVATFVAWRLFTIGHIGPVLFASFIWLGTFFYLVLFWAAFDAVRIFGWLAARFPTRFALPSGPRLEANPPENAELAARAAVSSGLPATEPQDPAPAPLIDRRLFLSRSFAAVSALGAAGVATAGVRSALDSLTEPVIEIRLPRLPRALDGFKIVHLTDLHIGPVLNRRFVRGVVERVNRLKPDMIAITGDLVDGPVSALAPDIEPLANLRSRYGTYFVTGNHEFYVGARQWIEYLPRLGVHVLDNERVVMGDPNSRGASFDLAGIHDPTGRRIEPAYAPDIDRAAAGRERDREFLLLAHQPAQVWAAVNSGASLLLCGHTHGGQLWPFGALVLISQPYLAGLHQHDPNTQIYVSRGVGFWGPPMRVLAPAEIATIVLRSA